METRNSVQISPEKTNWQSEADQQLWFERFKSPDVNGLRYCKFQEFLSVTLYNYFKTFPARDAPGVKSSSDTCGFSHQQEMQLFKVFDQKNDHILDFDEFSLMCQKWLDKIYHPIRAIVIVDVQNDFIDGSLALINGPAGQDGAEVVPVINNLLEANCFKTVVYTQDWHPIDHIGFHANLHLRKHTFKHSASSGRVGARDSIEENGENVQAIARDDVFKYKKMDQRARVFDTVLFDDGKIEQKLWPVHCVQNSWGAQLHPKLKMVHDAIYIQKGTLPHVDAYSAFWDNMRMNETGLRQELVSRKISDVYFCGLALDYCVAASALDSAKAGFTTYVIEDACRGIDLAEIEQRKFELKEHGVLIVNSNKLLSYQTNGANVMACKLLNGKGELGFYRSDSSSYLDRDTIKSISYRRAMM